MTKKICIVDDHLSMRQMLRFALTAYGLQVFEATNGVDALEILTDNNVDMLIIEWQMPQMDGLELIRRLRKTPHYTDVPIVIFSCLDNLEARKEARSLGVMTWLKKPFRMAEVQRIVEGSLNLASRSSVSLTAPL